MKAVITGMNGTLSPYIHNTFVEKGWDLVVWNRNKLPIDDPGAIQSFIDSEKPDLFLHIATGPPEWIEHIIKAIKPYKIPLVFTSSEAVYDKNQTGPFSVDDIPRSKQDYGKYKLKCENIINRDYVDQSYIIRLGWQIALHTHKNNLLAYLVNEGHVRASKLWTPACSFMPDTAVGILRLLKKYPPGLYHLDSNHSNMTFYEIVEALKEAFMLPITLEEDNSFEHNNRLHSDDPLVRELSKSINHYKETHHMSSEIIL